MNRGRGNRSIFGGFRPRVPEAQPSAEERARMAQWLDRYGRSIEPGDVVVIPGGTGSTEWVVRRVQPILAPNVQPGFVHVVLTATMEIPIKGGTPTGDTLLVLKAAERPVKAEEQEPKQEQEPESQDALAESQEPNGGPDGYSGE